MQTTVKAPNFDVNGDTRYGLGLGTVKLSGGGFAWSHGGDTPGFETRNGVTADGRGAVIAVTALPTSLTGAKHVADALDVALRPLAPAPNHLLTSNESRHTLTDTSSTVPPDDEQRDLVVSHPDDPALTHLAVVGDTYTFLVTGAQTHGRYALIDMLIPPDGGPPPHRHDFEEMFHILEGEIDVVFRGRTSTAHAGDTVNVPANAPHNFHNASGAPVRLLCMVSPAGLDDYFRQFGEPVASRTAAAPPSDDMPERMAKAMALAPDYRIENLAP